MCVDQTRKCRLGWLFSYLVIATVISCAPAGLTQVKSPRSEYSDFTSKFGENSEDSKFWRKVFAEGDTNLLKAEFTNRLSFGGRAEISHHLHYDEHISPAFLNLLADLAAENLSRYRRALTNLSASPNRDHELLSSVTNALYQNGGWFSYLAERPEIDRTLLEKLLKQAGVNPVDGQHSLKSSVAYEMFIGSLARNPGTPVDFLEELSTEDSVYIRKELAMNPNLPEPLLRKLIDDTERVLGGKERLPEGWRDSLMSGAREILERASETLAGKTAARTTLIQLAAHTNSAIRCAVAYNTNSPPEVLSKLASDSQMEVRRAASNMQARLRGSK